VTPTCRKTAVDVDQLARHLAEWGALGRSMPPAWDGAGVSVPIDAPGGGRIGRMLPGRGAYVDLDLKALGIKRPILDVFERTPMRRALDLLLDDRGDITTYNGIIAARTTGARDFTFTKNALTTVASAWSSLLIASGVPSAGSYTAIPGGAVFTRASAGAISGFMANPGSTTRGYLLTFGYGSSQALNMAILADALVGAGSIDANLNTSQTVNTTALTRYTGTAAACNMLTFEVTTALGATPANITATYTNESGTGSRSTGAIALTSSAIVGRMMPVGSGPFIQFASGDYGIRSLESVQLSAAMGSGVLAALIYRPLSFVPGIAAGVYMERDSTTQIDGVTEIAKDSSDVLGSLILLVQPGGSSSGTITGFMRTVVG